MATAVKVLPRDVFVNEIFQAAKRDRNIWFMSADFGAQALDQFRDQLKDQFIHAGISEQNMVDLAAGLALNGKIVYVYAMIPFVTLRCFEQIKVALATMNLPVTVVGVGTGYGYDDAGPTHYGTEDVSCMRALGNIEILCPGDTQSTLEAARRTYTRPAFRYVRLDRQFLPDIYREGDRAFVEEGVSEIDRGSDVVIITTGYMVPKARQARELLAAQGVQAGVVDVFRLKPLNGERLAAILKGYRRVVTLEEQFLTGGLGSAVVETLADLGIALPVKRLGVPDRYHFENGGREHVLSLLGLDVDGIVRSILSFLAARPS